MEALVYQRKKFCINFSKTRKKFSLRLHYSGDNSYLFANGREIFKFKANNKNMCTKGNKDINVKVFIMIRNKNKVEQ